MPNSENSTEIQTLEGEIKSFAEALPYWQKFIAAKILSGNTVSPAAINAAYAYLLEELKLSNVSAKPDITVTFNGANSGSYRKQLYLAKLEDVEGVNALVSNQTIQFSPNLTVIYGANGSGKSGYVRLLKNVFYSKAPEEILPNVHDENDRKPINGKFTFSSDSIEIPFSYAEKGNAEFEQFAVFDGKGVFRQLSERNEFEFRPAGLSFFSAFTAAIIAVEQKLNTDIAQKNSGNTLADLVDLFEGDSEIRSFVQSLNSKTKLADLKKYTAFTEEDGNKKKEIQKQYDDLLLASKGKEKEIRSLENIKKLLSEKKGSIEILNQHFNKESLGKVKAAIDDCTQKEISAKAEGIENYKTEKIKGTGTTEWKQFITAASLFSKKQNEKSNVYPQKGDNCLLCRQPLSNEASALITSYWKFINSVAEENAKNAQASLDKLRVNFETLDFALFPEDNTLTVWLAEKYPEQLTSWKTELSALKGLSSSIVSDILGKIPNLRSEIQVPTKAFIEIDIAIGKSIQLLKDDEQSKELEKLLGAKLFLEHKEKFNTHLSKFELFLQNQVWLEKASKVNFRKIKTDTTYAEKALSEKYFNQKYVDTFNKECQKLKGGFGVEISHTGSGGKSYRQLKLKGQTPNIILSEGEQKVIAIADFLAEMQMSDVNKGLILDDPVTSLDEKRKAEIAERLGDESLSKQTIIFTHDLVFTSNLLTYCEEKGTPFLCHWIENRDNKPGHIWLNNAPSHEKEYRNAEPARKLYVQSNKETCPPMEREIFLKQGFAALRTCYEVLVINDLFGNVVQRYNERVSIDSLAKITFDENIVSELMDSFAQCCRYMEGHTHSDKYAYKRPEPKDLNDEIQRFDLVKKKIKDAKKNKS